MVLTIILGNLGSGKTYIMTLLTYSDKRELWSNYKINSERYKQLDIIDLFDLPDNIILLMDEGYAWLESRASGDALNEYLSNILYHSRKTFSDIYITTPDFSTIDKRFRKLVNYIIFCKHRDNFLSDDFQFLFYDKENHSFGSHTILYSNAKKYFNLYNTYEKIESHRKRKLEFKLLSKYPLRLKEYVIDLVESINGKISGLITHDKVKDYLLMEGIDLAFEKTIYIRLKGMKNDNDKNK